MAPIGVEAQPEGEPSGRGGSTEPSTPTTTTTTTEPPDVPESREWCGAIIDTDPRPVLRTSSFLLAWNEIRVADGRAPAGPIPLNEHDARLVICGSATCEATTPRTIEFNHTGKLSIGTVVADGRGNLLAITDLSPFFDQLQCANSTETSARRIGDHLQVTALVEPRPYVHHGYYGYGGCYGGRGRHDVFIDVETGMIELEIEHRGAPIEVTAVDEGGLQVTLNGCSTTLELSWTQPRQG